MSQNGLKHINEPTIPKHFRNSAGYGGEELRFRRFLFTYTLIGLEIMETDLLHARRLFATFRWQVMRAGDMKQACADLVIGAAPFLVPLVLFLLSATGEGDGQLIHAGFLKKFLKIRVLLAAVQPAHRVGTP